MSDQPSSAYGGLTLVVGATGLLGDAICQELRRRHGAVRALVRSPEKERPLLAHGCEVVRGDLKDAPSLARACAGVDTVITTANAMLSRQSGNSLERVDRHGSTALVAAARANGVRRFIFTSASPTLPSDNPFIRYKREAEEAVRSSGMTWTVLQPTAFMEVHTGPAGGWDLARGRARVAGSGRAPLSYISVADVAAFAVESIVNPRAANRSLHLAGPEPLSALEAIGIAERVTGRPFSVQRLPIGALRVMALLAGPFNPGMASLFRMLVAMEAGEVVDMAPLRREFPIQPTTFEQYVRRTLDGRPASSAAPGLAT